MPQKRRRCARSRGMSFSDVVSVQVYLTDMDLFRG